MQIRTPIIPTRLELIGINKSEELNKPALCIFAAIGFFLDQDNFKKSEIALSAASITSTDEHNQYLNHKKWFNWHYSPRNISLSQAVDDFSDLFELIIEEQVGNQKVILPLSGGIDSRTQAAALRKLGKKVHSYSYKFQNGYDETFIAKQIALSCKFKFDEFVIPKGYLWYKLDDLSNLNKCQTDFTLPRQMAVNEHFAELGEIFSLGHWGDVLFDNMGLSSLSEAEMLVLLKSKLIKRGGLKLAQDLWKTWSLDGDFEEYLDSRLVELLDQIEIENPNAKLRAFKSLYWAPRWTSANLCIFQEKRPISLPYFDDRMCEFICTIPEEYLADRKIQIEYIKRNAPDLAKITWQDKRPNNLYDYQEEKPLKKILYKLQNKSGRVANSIMGKPYIQRNWELQYLGDDNDKKLKEVLFNTQLDNMVSNSFIENIYQGFKTNPLLYAHSIGMLLVFAKYNQHHNNE
ncbi:Asparagine synthase [Flavobacteriaceae bacterium MAR_2010_188]|nr:Asparagine synthase [Flavobacteriaceae bacterium MAR_2010_188]